MAETWLHLIFFVLLTFSLPSTLPRTLLPTSTAATTSTLHVSASIDKTLHLLQTTSSPQLHSSPSSSLPSLQLQKSLTLASLTPQPQTTSSSHLHSSSDSSPSSSFLHKSSNDVVFSPQTTSSFDLHSSSSSSSLLSLQLHPRISLHRSSHPDYKSLTVARLARDSDRVNSLQTRLNLAVNGVKKTDLNPVVETEDLQVPVTSGVSQGSGEYFCRVGIGRPASQVYMVLDSGSDVNWVQCAPCLDCYHQADPIFEPAASSSFSPLTCDTHQCRSLDVSECRNGTCLYEVSYGDGSYTVGDFVTETVSFQGSTAVKDVAIGCGHNNEGLFVGAAGLIALGGGTLSFPSQINATSYSYCFVDRDSDSASTLEFNSPMPRNAVKAPLLRSAKLETFYYVGLAGLSVAGELVRIPAETFRLTSDGDSGVIVDSGTAVTRLPTAAYNALRDAFLKGTTELPAATGVSLFDACYDLSKKKSVQVPTVSFHFTNGEKLDLPAKNYLIPVDSAGTFCFGFAPTSSSLSIIGNVQQQGTRVSYDLENSLFGFSPDQC